MMLTRKKGVRILVKASFFLLILMLFSCEGDSIKLDESFTIDYQKTRYFNEGYFGIQFKELVSDSRCPTGAVCIWAGQAVVTISIGDEEQSTDFDLVLGQLNTGQSITATWGKYTIELTKVDPYPNANKKAPSKSSYKIQLVIKENE